MIIGLIEHEEGDVAKLSLEALTFARELAAAEDVPLAAVVIGDDVEALAAPLAAYGVTAVYLAEDERLDSYAPDAWAAALVHLIQAEEPTAVLASGSDKGNEVLARVAARLDQPMAANCLTVEPREEGYFLTRVRWGGTLWEEATLTGAPRLLTVAQHALEPQEAPTGSQLDIHAPEVEFDDADFQVRVTSRIVPEREGVTLADAPVVVGGGRGVGSTEGFDSLEELATLLDGAVGCSRAVTSNGWRPHADQVGQTGARIAPTIYIACGISGASQHMSGCASSKHILVINTDPEAPILSKADYAVIGDLHEVVPAVSAEIKRRRGE